MRIQTLWLQKNLMPFTVAKAENLVLNRRAITRSLPLNRATKQGRAIKAAADNVMGFGVGSRDRAK